MTPIWLHGVDIINFLFLSSALPLLFVLIPLIVDLATGNSAADDIVVHRANSSTEDISL